MHGPGEAGFRGGNGSGWIWGHVLNNGMWSHACREGANDSNCLGRGGGADDQNLGGRLRLHIFTCSEAPWLDLPRDARSAKVYYDTQAEWPAESLARRKALMAR